jgi:hypothetical protein
VLAGYSATLLLASAFEDVANLVAIKSLLPAGGVPLLCDVVKQFSAFQLSLGLLPQSAAEGHQKLLRYFELEI